MQFGKAATKVEKDKIKETLIACRQMGWQFSPFVLETVGTRGGKARNLLLKVDMKNAFGSLLRDVMLEQVKTLYPYAAACYRHPNLLLGDGFSINSSRGVQHADLHCLPLAFIQW